MKFCKMHGLGNDFIVIDAFLQTVDDASELARKWCPRRFGVGADGLILAVPSEVADARMIYHNSDGSPAEMCGNGVRCLGKFLYDSGLCRKNPMTVETGAGVLTLRMTIKAGHAVGVTVDMGAPVFAPEAIPVDAMSNRVTLEACGKKLDFFCASMGNPHAVTFDLYPDDETFRALGAALEVHPTFPRWANIEFCRVREDGGIDVRVWERGDGETLACGTGACAVLAAAASQKLTGREADVHLPGGVLHILWADDGRLFMTGPAETVYFGEVDA